MRGTAAGCGALDILRVVVVDEGGLGTIRDDRRRLVVGAKLGKLASVTLYVS